MIDGSVPPIASDDEQLRRLYGYWHVRRGASAFPARADLDPLDFPYALGRVSLVEVERDPVRFRYRLVSTTLTEHLGYEMTGKCVEDIPEPSMRAFTRSFYERALARRAPLHEVGRVVIEGHYWQHEVLVLPLAADGETIDMLLIYRKTERPKAVSFAVAP